MLFWQQRGILLIDQVKILWGRNGSTVDVITARAFNFVPAFHVSLKHSPFSIFVLLCDESASQPPIPGRRANDIKVKFSLISSFLDHLKKNLMCQLLGYVLSHWSSAILFKDCPPVEPDILNQHFFGTTWLWITQTSLYLNGIA